jgi:hypothetical protein
MDSDLDYQFRRVLIFSINAEQRKVLGLSQDYYNHEIGELNEILFIELKGTLK